MINFNQISSKHFIFTPITYFFISLHISYIYAEQLAFTIHAFLTFYKKEEKVHAFYYYFVALHTNAGTAHTDTQIHFIKHFLCVRRTHDDCLLCLM